MGDRPTIDQLLEAGYGPNQAISPTRRRTLRQKADIKRGIHPATKMPLAGNGETCRTCIHSVAHQIKRTYWKCDLMPVTSGPGSDIRLSWPACTKWEPYE
jgi:hypothetical protein